jgi:hypothetical protein
MESVYLVYRVFTALCAEVKHSRVGEEGPTQLFMGLTQLHTAIQKVESIRNGGK